MSTTRQRKAPVKKRAAGKKPVARRRSTKQPVEKAEATVLPRGAFISAKASLRTVLDAIDSYLAHGIAGSRLASVMSAMRGPDLEDGTRFVLKEETTAILRAKAFPVGGWGIGSVDPNGTLRQARKAADEAVAERSEASHFAHHILSAIDALEAA